MKILYINTLYEPFIGGGAEITIKHLVTGIRDLGHEVKVLSFWDKKDSEDLINKISLYRAKIPNLYLPYGEFEISFKKKLLWHFFDIYNPKSKKIVSEQVKKFNPDIISFHNLYGWSSSVWEVVDEFDIPAVQVLHDLYILCPRNMFKNGEVCDRQCFTCKVARFPWKLKSRKLEAVVGVSNFILNKYISLGYFKGVPIKKVIYNSRNIENISLEKKVDPKYINFGFIGTLSPSKGIELLLKSFHKVKKKHYKLFVAGSGKKDYVQYLHSRYKDDSIVFMGRVDPKKFFSRVDVTIVPSVWYEPLGMVVVESFAFGTPVIGSNIGGIPEMITADVNGMIFDPFKEGDLEEKMLIFEKRILEWRSKYESIKQSAKKFLDYKKWINQWEELYKLVIYKR
ncbi:glycosyltransferase involved in cell wall biosynthesis [Thermosipho japonicus]|uniref:Glycosyltransferase involved in cell wall biosynthesis n=1 Tax=Thermosipho japonicus TaxID=90323 RepID=A0A841GLE4_9BACT|nr:glycosyltransferase family 4 protein [Thermosipho japonicus]MBB6062815.1 glycosyltransferase involved in cell wall biosynthesis [Thermosipho japonicus]